MVGDNFFDFTRIINNFNITDTCYMDANINNK